MGMYGSTMRVRLRRDRPRVAAVLHCGNNKKMLMLGFEPKTFALSAQRSTKLSYTSFDAKISQRGNKATAVVGNAINQCSNGSAAAAATTVRCRPGRTIQQYRDRSTMFVGTV